ncbi:MAG: hypothetical protein WC155_03980 [Candidatus Cloacimonadales bacterium]
MNDIDLLKLYEKMNSIELEFKLHRQEHKYMRYWLISLFCLGVLISTPASAILQSII